MATPTRPCPYCGAAVLMNAPSCGTCGRPMPPAQAGAPPAGQPAKTMFGYAAPQVPRPGAPAPAPAPAAGARPGAPAPGGFQPPQPQGFQPPQPQGFPPPQQGGFQPPPQQQGFQPPPQQQGFQPPPQQQGFQPPPQQQGFQPPQQGGYPPAQGGYPPAQGGFGAQPGYPQAPNPYAQPQDAGGQYGGGGMAGHLPHSAPGTLFGFPISTLRDPAVQKKILFLAGVALVASILVPFHLSPTVFSWDFPDKFKVLIWPIIAGAAYLLVAAAPPNLRQNVPPVVLQWLPFGVSFAGLFMLGEHYDGLYILGYATVVFGLLARIAQPQDQTARIIIAVGSGMLFIRWIDMFNLFHFSGLPALFVIHNLLWFVVVTLGVACVLFVVPPQKLPPAMQAVDAFGPLICALLLVWLPFQVVLMGLIDIVHGHAGASAVLEIAHGLLPILAYFLVLMMSSPAAYEEAKALVAGQRGGGGGPPPGGGYGPPPGGGGYPPQGGGYPPQGGGYPPQGGGGYPPQQGGWQ